MPYPYITTMNTTMCERPFFYIVYCKKPKLNSSNSGWKKLSSCKLSFPNLYFLKKKNQYVINAEASAVEANAVEANAVEANAVEANAVVVDDIKIKCKGPYSITEAEKQSANYLRTSFIIYNATKKTFIHEPRQTEYALDMVHNLITWARNHIKGNWKMLPSIPEEPATLEPAALEPAMQKDEDELSEAAQLVPASLAPAPLAPAPLAPAALARNETKDDAICVDNAPAAWGFYEHNIIYYEQETKEFDVEIGNIANMVYKIIKAYGADFEAIAELAKGITFNIGIGMRHQKASNEIFKEIDNPDDNTSTYLLVKINKKMRGNKIKISGLCRHSVNAAFFSVDFSLIRPTNAAAKKICDELMDRKIQNKIKYLKQNTIEYDSIVKRHTIYTSKKYVPGMYTKGVTLGIIPPNDTMYTLGVMPSDNILYTEGVTPGVTSGVSSPNDEQGVSPPNDITYPSWFIRPKDRTYTDI
jgi:hypothetical protein